MSYDNKSAPTTPPWLQGADIGDEPTASTDASGKHGSNAPKAPAYDPLADDASAPSWLPESAVPAPADTTDPSRWIPTGGPAERADAMPESPSDERPEPADTPAQTPTPPPAPAAPGPSMAHQPPPWMASGDQEGPVPGVPAPDGPPTFAPGPAPQFGPRTDGPGAQFMNQGPGDRPPFDSRPTTGGFPAHNSGQFAAPGHHAAGPQTGGPQPGGFAGPPTNDFPGPAQHEFGAPPAGFAPPPPGYDNGPGAGPGMQPGPPMGPPISPPPISPMSDPFAQPGPPFGAPDMGGMPGAQPGSLDEVALLRKARRAPHSGWRRAVHKISAGAINPGDSPDDIYYQQLIERVNRPVRGDYRIAVLSLKGGVGKTTTTVGLGSVFASLRGDRVIAVDANPDLGTLAQRVPQQTRSTVRDLLADTSIYRYSDVRAHTSQAPSRLEVLASERDPAVAEAFSDDDYRGVMRVLQRFYNIIITDCGTGLSHSAMNGVLDLANALILVSSPAIDGARSAGATLDWLQAHGYGHLVSRAVVVLSSSRSGASTIDTQQLSQHFLTRCRAVQMVPFDDHLAEGAEVDLELLSKQAHRALVELAAVVADDFSGTTMRRNEPFMG